MDYIHKKLNNLRILIHNNNNNNHDKHSTATNSSDTSKQDEDVPLNSLSRETGDPCGESEDILSLPTCSKSEEEVQSNVSSNGSTENSIVSLLGKQHIVKRSEQFRYQDAVRSATYSKSEFVLHALQWHNIVRSHHGVTPLMLSLELCQKAQFWANHLSHTDTFYHMNDPEIGQNLMSKWTYYSEFDPSAEDVCKYWYNYIDSYDFSLEPHLLHTQSNHFTQLIWKSCKYFGIGKARTRNGKLIIVANYIPPGNVSNKFAENVLPPMFGDLESRRNTCILKTNHKLIVKSAKKLKRNRRLSPLITLSNGSNVNSSL
ncbi:uncharacterized protein LOC128955741 [Oppia nitens]|uniref:uncharacterized protein LOC128955741 n=1 Tax=Oppia nitens TaxID=1686743 RepID=UPI0023DABFF4|nr:uncharacterized protein LOC128955741 [Oppia nitens]